MNVDRLLTLGRCSAVAVSPDGTWLAVCVGRVDAKGANFVSDLWRVPLDGGSPVRLTWGDEKLSSPAFRDDGALLFLSNRPVAAEPEDERNTQVWHFPPGLGEPRPLTDEPLGVEAFRVACGTLATLSSVIPGVPHAEQRATALDRRRNGPSLLRYTEMPVRFWDHWIAPAAPHLVVRTADGQGRRDLTPDAGMDYRESAWDLSPDGTQVRIARATRAADAVRSDVLEQWDVAAGTCTSQAWATGARQGIAVVRFPVAPGAPDVAIVERRDGGGAPRQVLIAHADGVERVWDDHNPHDVVFLDADHLAVVVDRDGREAIRTITLDGTAPDAWTNVGSHTALHTRPGNPTLYGLHHRFVHPPEPFRMPLGAGPTVVARLSGYDPAEAAVEVTELRVPGAGGTPIHAFVVARQGLAAAAPGLFWIHGGPVGAYADGWHWRWNPLVAVDAGYTVCLPNPRGSTGYGWPFVDGIWGNTWGDACYHDLMAVADAFEALPSVDPARMVAMGGSFGGYMVNWMGTQTSRFRALVSHAGLWNLAGFAGVTDEPAWWRLELAGATWIDEAWVNRYSPHRGVSAWSTPVLILHGDKDYRVPVGEALQMFDALLAHGVDAELGVFPDENHWILKPRNIRAWYAAWIGFLAARLGLDVPLTTGAAGTRPDGIES